MRIIVQRKKNSKRNVYKFLLKKQELRLTIEFDDHEVVITIEKDKTKIIVNRDKVDKQKTENIESS